MGDNNGESITFLGFPPAGLDDLIKDTIAILGVKYASLPMTRNAGVQDSPDVIRKLSGFYSGIIFRNFNEIDLHYKDIVDIGNISIENLAATINSILSKGAKALVIGGDHAITFFALFDARLNSLLWLDAHLDIGKNNELDHSNVLRHIIKRKKEMKVKHYGFRGYSAFTNELHEARELGVKVRTIDETFWLDLSKDISTVDAVSLDLDFFSVEQFTATVYPELRGASLSHFVEMIRKADLSNIKYFDVVEYASKLDYSKNYGKIVVQIIMEILASL